MRPLRRQTLTPIGLDLGTRSAKAVQLLRHGQQARLLRTCRFEWPEPAEQPVTPDTVGRLRAALARAGFEGGHAVVAVPAGQLLCERLELPPRSSGAPVDQIARAELARIAKADPDSFELAHWDLPAPARAGKTLHVMALGCRHTDSDALLDLLEFQGLRVGRLETAVTAAARLLTPRQAQDGAAVAVLDFGWSAATMFVVYHGVIAYHRRIEEAGLHRVYRLLGEQLGLDHQATDVLLDEWDVSSVRPEQDVPEARAIVAPHLDALAAEIRTSCSYVAHQYPDAALNGVTLVGGGANAKGFDSYLARSLNVVVRAAGRPNGIDDPGRSYGPEWVTAIGLACSGTGLTQ